MDCATTKNDFRDIRLYSSNNFFPKNPMDKFRAVSNTKLKVPSVYELDLRKATKFENLNSKLQSKYKSGGFDTGPRPSTTGKLISPSSHGHITPLIHGHGTSRGIKGLGQTSNRKSSKLNSPKASNEPLREDFTIKKLLITKYTKLIDHSNTVLKNPKIDDMLELKTENKNIRGELEFIMQRYKMLESQNQTMIQNLATILKNKSILEKIFSNPCIKDNMISDVECLSNLNSDHILFQLVEVRIPIIIIALHVSCY